MNLLDDRRDRSFGVYDKPIINFNILAGVRFS